MKTMLPRVTDYWDERVGSIGRKANELGELDAEERAGALQQIGNAVTKHVGALPDELLVQAAIPIADDLYKAACSTVRWDASIAAYLEASAGTFWALFAKRGFVCRYLVDNAWEDLTRPLDLLPGWFKTSGLIYACPQAIARELMKGDGEKREAREAMPKYIGEARAVTARIVSKALEARQSFVLLDADFDQRSFQAVFEAVEAPGVLTLFRNEAPTPGTTVNTWLPVEMRNP